MKRMQIASFVVFFLFAAVSAMAQATSPNVTGSQGDVIVNGDAARAGSGVVLRAKAGSPSVSAQTGTAATDSGFTIFNASNKELLRVRSDGNVGIGTANPRGLLTLAKNTAGGLGAHLVLENNAGQINDSVAMSFFDIDAIRAQIRMTIDPQLAVGVMTFATGLYELQDRMIITPTGQIRTMNMAGHADLLVASGDNPGAPHSPLLRIQRADGNNAPIVEYGFWIDPADNALKLVQTVSQEILRGHPMPVLMTMSGGNGQTPKLTVNGAIVGTVYGAVYQDLAEWVPASSDLSPGTVVVLDESETNQVMPSGTAYDERVAGVVSAQPGIILGLEGTDKEMVATTGRVRVKVDASTPIRIGDLLVTSHKPGMAMKSERMKVGDLTLHRPGTIIGKALEPLASGEGEILVLLSLQ